MSLRDKIFNIANTIKRHFVMPFCFSIFIILITISSLGLKISSQNNSVILYTGLVFGFIAFFLWFRKLDEENKAKKLIIEFCSPLFLMSLFIITISNLNFIIEIDLHLINDINLILILVSIFSGFVVFYVNKNKTNLEIENFKSNSKNNKLKYYIIFFFLILIGASLLFYNLGKNNFINDEFPTIETASNYANTGNFWKWDWLEKKSGEITNCAQEDEYCNYTRAEIHTVLLGLSYKILGVSEFSSRLVSVIFGLILFTIFFFIKKQLLNNKEVVLLSLFILIFSPKIIELFRYARMYALLMPLFFLLQFLIFKIIYEFCLSKLSYRRAIFYSFFIILLFGICYNLHSQALLILIPSFVFLFYLLLKSKKYFYLYILGLISLAFILLLKVSWSYITSLETATEFIKLGARINGDYVNLLFGYPLGWIGFSLATALFLKFIFTSNNKEEEYFIFSYLICIIQLFILVYIIDRFSHPVYISNLFPLSIFVSVYALYYFVQLFFKKSYVSILILILLAIFSFYSKVGIIYGNENFYYANYTEAYKSIISNYNPEQDVIFMSYSKKYYLRNLDYKNGGFHLFGNKDYSSEAELNLIKKIKSYNSGYITWDKYAEGDIKTSTREYIRKNFKQLTGSGIDDTRVEVFYFNKNMF